MYKTIDLFAGAGGLSLGFQQTGEFKIVAAAEINENAKATYTRNIVKGNDTFIFIDDVVRCNFEELSEKLGEIDVVIGGPPCQGFSNANRQKNHLINISNNLAKEFVRAIKEIKPKAFVMENVSMLKSDTHRFYYSKKDKEELENLIYHDVKIQRKEEKIVVIDNIIEINMMEVAESPEKAEEITLPPRLQQAVKMLNYYISDEEKLNKYLGKNSSQIKLDINSYTNMVGEPNENQRVIINKLNNIYAAIESSCCDNICDDLVSMVSLQKALRLISEVRDHELIGKYDIEEDNNLIFVAYSYSVIDYINAVLGTDYIHVGHTLNAENFGVPQERRRYVMIGVKRNIIDVNKIVFPSESLEHSKVTVSEAISDLIDYPAGYDKDYEDIPYYQTDRLSEYAKEMRKNSKSVKNHITTLTTDAAMKRFKAIRQGENFQSLSSDMKETYAKPERTQSTIYLRLNPNEPSGTVVNVRKSMWIHPTLDRAVTVREAARLQSFPDWFKFVGTKDSQYQQVGNAVPPLLAESIAKELVSILK